VLVVCHALTGNASLHAWWGDMLGPGKAFDTDSYFVVCCNILGSCYGSSNPNSIDPQKGEKYGLDFPDISVKDTVRLQLFMLVNQLQLASVLCVIGGSFGGMQTMEFAVQAGSLGSEFRARNVTTSMPNNSKQQQEPFVKSAVAIACGAAHTAWQIGISEVQRQAIYADPNWPENAWEATQGLAVARQVGMVTYRTPAGYCKHFGRRMQP
jgi:homoserine O-acetyltransferase